MLNRTEGQKRHQNSKRELAALAVDQHSKVAAQAAHHRMVKCYVREEEEHRRD